MCLVMLSFRRRTMFMCVLALRILWIRGLARFRVRILRASSLLIHLCWFVRENPTSRVSVAIGKTIRPLMHEEGRPRSAVVPTVDPSVHLGFSGFGGSTFRVVPGVSCHVVVSASYHVHVRPRPAYIVDQRARSVPGTDPTGQFFVDPPVLVREVHTSVASSRTTVFPFPTGGFYSVPPGFAGSSLPGMAPPSRQPVSDASSGGWVFVPSAAGPCVQEPLGSSFSSGPVSSFPAPPPVAEECYG